MNSQCKSLVSSDLSSDLEICQAIWSDFPTGAHWDRVGAHWNPMGARWDPTGAHWDPTPGMALVACVKRLVKRLAKRLVKRLVKRFCYVFQ